MVKKITKQMKEEPDEDEEQQVEQPITPEPQPQLVVKDVYELSESTMEAYFKVSDTEFMKRISNFRGVMVKGNENIPVLLVVNTDGLLLPPFMIPGFVGMYPIADLGPDPDLNNPDEPEQQPVAQNQESIDTLRKYATKEEQPQPDPEAQIDNII